MATTHTFSVNKLLIRVVKWILIGCGLLLVTDTIYHIMQGADPNYENLVTGVFFLFIGFGCDYYFGSITVNSDAITHHRKKMGLMPEKHQPVHWKDIRRVMLCNSSIRLTDNSDTTVKFPLPNYASSKFQELKELLSNYADRHNAEFTVSRWW